LKKTLLVVVVMTLIIGLCAGTALAKSDNGKGQGQGQELLLQTETQKFTDVEGHWAAWAINKANSKGLMVGHGDGRFGPEEALTNAQAIVLIDKLNAYIEAAGTEEEVEVLDAVNGEIEDANIDEEENDGDKKGKKDRDLEAEDYTLGNAPPWAMPSVQKAVYKGYINRFNSEQQCLRASAFAVLAQELLDEKGINEEELKDLVKDYANPFTDLVDGEQFAAIEDEIGVPFEVLYNYMLWLHQENIIKGWNGNLNPNRNFTRGEAAVLMDQVSENLNNDEEDDGEDVNIEEEDDEDEDDVKDKNKDNEDEEDLEDDLEDDTKE